MSKPIIEVSGPLYIHNIMFATLAQDVPDKGWKKGQDIRTSPIIARNPVNKSVETKHTIYVVVDDVQQDAQL